jgi:hypothetical protein
MGRLSLDKIMASGDQPHLDGVKRNINWNYARTYF